MLALLGVIVADDPRSRLRHQVRLLGLADFYSVHIQLRNIFHVVVVRVVVLRLPLEYQAASTILS